MSIFLSMITKFFSDIFSAVIIDALKTPAETFEIIEEKGVFEYDSEINDILNDFSDL